MRYTAGHAREECMRRREFCLGLAAMPALARSAFAQEVSSITLIKQHGLPYLPMMLMEEFRLVEKHAAKFGVANLKTDYRTLGGTQSLIDALTITLPHPDAAIAIISKSSELTAHYGVSPFQNYEVAAPGTHVVLKSYDTLGGPTTNGVVFMAKKFRDANPKVTSAVYAAFEEVSEFIRREPRQSAEVYIRMTNEKRSNADEMAKMISDPDNVWAQTPLNAV